MMTTFYVDQIFENGRIGVATSQNKLAYNNSLISKKLVDTLTDEIVKNNEGALLGYKGRYIYLTQVSLDQKISEITFVDFNKDEKYLLEMAMEFAKDSEFFSKRLIDTFYKQLNDYDKICNDAILVLGEPPPISS